MKSLILTIVSLMHFGLPLIYANQQLAITPVQFLSINDSVKIHCHFKHDDKQLANNIKLEWFDGPLPMKAATNGITIKDSKTVTTIKSTLVFDKIQDLHFGRYTCKATSIKGAIKTATTSLLTKGTNGQEQAFIKDVHLTKPQQVLVECSAPDNQHSSWKKVDFDQSVVSIKTNSTSFYHNVSSLQATGKFIYSNDNTVFCISYVYPEGYQQLKFTKEPPSSLVYHDLSQKLLTCIVSSSLKPNMKWSLNGTKLEAGPVRRVNIVEQVEELNYELQLQFNPPIPNLDTGKYTFTAENEWEKIEKDVTITFNIVMKEPFQVVTINSPKYMIKGADFTASCLIVKRSAVGMPITIAFYNYETSTYIVAGDDPRIEITSEGHLTIAKLRISSATRKDSGISLCIAASFAHQSMKSIVTEFKERPMEIIEYSSTKYSNEKANGNTIFCKVQVFDTSVINTTTIWFTHQNKHTSTLYEPTTSSVDMTKMLITANLNLSSTHHHNTYECITRATILDNPPRIYNDSKMLHISLLPMEPLVKTVRSRSAGLEFTVQGLSNHQSTDQMNRTIAIFTMIGIFVLVLGVVLVLVIKGHRSKYNKLNQQFV